MDYLYLIDEMEFENKINMLMSISESAPYRVLSEGAITDTIKSIFTAIRNFFIRIKDSIVGIFKKQEVNDIDKTLDNNRKIMNDYFVKLGRAERGEPLDDKENAEYQKLPSIKMIDFGATLLDTSNSISFSSITDYLDKLIMSSRDYILEGRNKPKDIKSALNTATFSMYKNTEFNGSGYIYEKKINPKEKKDIQKVQEYNDTIKHNTKIIKDTVNKFKNDVNKYENELRKMENIYSKRAENDKELYDRLMYVTRNITEANGELSKIIAIESKLLDDCVSSTKQINAFLNKYCTLSPNK